MLILRCKAMRRMVYAAGTLFLFGILLQIVTNLFEPGAASLLAYLPYLAFAFMLVSPMLLIVTVLIGLSPDAAKKLNSWEH